MLYCVYVKVVFTFEKVSAPRLSSKSNPVDEPGAHTSRMWLRELVIGKSVSFETRKQGDRVYGLLFMKDNVTDQMKNLAVESVRLGLSSPKLYNENMKDRDDATSPEEADPYDVALTDALREAVNKGVGIHDETKKALVRPLKNANEGDFSVSDLVSVLQASKSGTIKVLIDYVFDGSRYRVQITDDAPEYSEFQYGNFTLILGGVMCPRLGNSKVEPPTHDEPLSQEARSFVELRLLNRELNISLHGVLESMQSTGIGTLHHPKGDISLELLKRGLARIADWSLRVLLAAPKGCMSGVMVLRKAESDAKNLKLGVWKEYVAPTISGVLSFEGQVIEVSSGDTLLVLPSEEIYDSEEKLRKISLSSIRAPRIGNEKVGRPQEPYAYESKERLRVLSAGKKFKITIDYERDIPLAPGESEKRQYATLIGKKGDVGEILVAEGLATTQRHRDDEEKSPRYGELCTAENAAKLAKKGVHSAQPYSRRPVNDLSEPRKAKSYCSSLQRAGMMKGIIEYVYNGCRLKIYIPKENCSCNFTLDDVRCPQPTPVSSRDQRKAEPCGDKARIFSRARLLQRNMEFTVNGCTNGGVMTGKLYVNVSGKKISLSDILLKEGLAYIEQRSIDYGKVPAHLIELQNTAKAERIGLWSFYKEEEVKVVQPAKKSIETSTSVRISEIRNGRHIFFTVDDEAVDVVSESMKIFTSKYGINGAPCDIKKGKLVAALFNDGSGKSWYRAKILDRIASKGKISVLFIDHGNIAFGRCII